MSHRRRTTHKDARGRPQRLWWIVGLALLAVVTVWAGNYLMRPRAAAEPATEVSEIPHIHGLALRLAFPYGRHTGLPCSVAVTNAGVRRALSTGSVDCP